MSRHVFNSILKAMFGSAAQGVGQWGKPEHCNGESSMPPWILHVEDDAQFSAGLKTRLEAHGVAVIRAFDGMDGVRTAFKHPADAILLDVEMPNGSGDEVLRLLKETESTRNIPVIFLTCRKDRVFRRKMLAMGAAAYLNKPLDFSELQRELANYIDILANAANPSSTDDGKSEFLNSSLSSISG